MGEVGTLSIVLWSPLVAALALLATGRRLPEVAWQVADMKKQQLEVQNKTLIL